MNINQFLQDKNLVKEFPDDVMAQVEIIPNEVKPKDLWNRSDFRHLRTVTIDGADAKDFDDAISIEQLPNGNYKLYVHISDVAHYVREGSPLDKCAYERGTSVYLPPHVVPMLPEKLSNGVCSLNPGVDRLTMSVVMEINDKGKVEGKPQICESVINSDQRMTYHDVTAILEGNPQLHRKYEEHVDDFRHMRKLAEILQRKRKGRGALFMDIPEPHFTFDEAGEPVDVRKYDLTVSNNMIEEFMLIANETIAKRMEKKKIPLVYRVHEDPDSEKILKLAEMLKSRGITLETNKGSVESKHLQEVLQIAKDRGCEKAVGMVLLRSLMKARYCEENRGHFGLATEYYCHFTAPIRRYPDLCVHRKLKAWIKDKNKGNEAIVEAGGISEKLKLSKQIKQMAETAGHSSQTERHAEKTEREWDDINICKIMEPKVGEEFPATIVGVEQFGIFVELDNLAQGLVPIQCLKGGHYIYDDVRRTLRSQHGRDEYKIGDRMPVRLDAVRVDMGEMNFSQVITESERVKTPYHSDEVVVKTKSNSKKDKGKGKNGNKRDDHAKYHSRRGGNGRGF
jgi:ribonuclease R